MTPLRTVVPVLFLLALLSGACSGGPETGPGEIRWDRHICARCSMVISERQHAAQVRGGPVGGPGKLFLFDDLGCAVVWLDAQPWGQDPDIEIWVAAHEDGAWLDARTASYATGVRTPMDYALGARAEAAEGLIDFEGACEQVRAIEERHAARKSRRPEGGGLGQ